VTSSPSSSRLHLLYCLPSFPSCSLSTTENESSSQIPNRVELGSASAVRIHKEIPGNAIDKMMPVPRFEAALNPRRRLWHFAHSLDDTASYYVPPRMNILSCIHNTALAKITHGNSITPSLIRRRSTEYIVTNPPSGSRCICNSANGHQNVRG
jgi:hypothetical protein